MRTTFARQRCWLGLGAPAALLAIFLGAVAVAQTPASALRASVGAPADSLEAADRLGRSTPRSAIVGFLEACHRHDYIKAARYLDLAKLPLSAQWREGPDRARALSLLLDRDPHFELDQLDDTPQGRQEDTLPADIDLLVTFQLDERPVPLYLEHVIRNGAQIWLVSSDSVSRLPELAALGDSSPLEKWIPTPLVQTTLFGTPVWVYLALVLTAVLLFALSRAIFQLVVALVKPLASRYMPGLSGLRLTALAQPFRLLLSVTVFRGCMEAIAPSALLRDLLLKVLALLFVFGAASLAMRLVELLSDRWISRLDPRERAMSYSVLPLGVRFVKICLLCLAGLIVLRQWGVNISAVLAGVGVGGLAVALAAQKTIENLFGGVSVISDRPVLVGDTCQFGGQVGVVEDIGLRSTRIRTNDRTVVTVPNAQFSTMTLENLSRRDRFWFHPTLPLRRDLTPEKLREALQVIERVLREEPQIDPTDVPVRFTKIATTAFEVEIFCYVRTADGNTFLRIQSELLLRILEELQTIDVQLAVPFQEFAAVGSEESATADQVQLLR